MASDGKGGCSAHVGVAAGRAAECCCVRAPHSPRPCAASCTPPPRTPPPPPPPHCSTHAEHGGDAVEALRRELEALRLQSDAERQRAAAALDAERQRAAAAEQRAAAAEQARAAGGAGGAWRVATAEELGQAFEAACAA